MKNAVLPGYSNDLLFIGFWPFPWELDQLEVEKSGKIKPLLDRAIPLKETYEAHRLIANNEVSGNIVLLSWVS